jgi:hypothetical protein
MPDVQLLRGISDSQLVVNRIDIGRLIVLTTPLFPESEDGRLRGDPTTTIHTQDANQPWCALAGWLKLPSDADHATVQCRKTGLTVRLDAQGDASASLLPFDSGSPAAALLYTDSAGQSQRVPFAQAAVDVQARTLTLTRPFAPEERELYGQVTNAISSNAAAASIEVDYTHRYRIQPAPQPTGGGGRLGWLFGRRGIDTGVVLMRPAAAEQPVAAMRLTPAMLQLDPALLATPAQPRTAMLRPDLLQQLTIDRTDFHRVVVDPEPPPPGDTVRDATFTQQFSVRLQPRLLTDADTFPDLVLARQQGWSQVPGRDGKPPLFFRFTDEADAFQYVPAAYKLGYYLEHEGGGAGRPPMSAELYLDHASGDYRVKVTLVALPFVEDVDREALRTYIWDSVLKRTQPYVGLSLRGGLQADFVADFASGSADDQQQLPASIVFSVVEKQPEDRLVLAFDMKAWDYAIFCELLRRGLYGRVALQETGLQATIPVRLRLDDVVANGLLITSHAPDATTTASGSGGATSPPLLDVTIANALQHPVQLSSMSVFLVDRSEIPGVNFDAEQVALLPSGRSLGPQADPSGSATLPYTPKRVSTWDLTVSVPGVIEVDGGTVDDWLNRVNQDSSLQSHDFKVSVQLSTPAAGADRVQLVNVRVYEDGDTTPRSTRQLLPAAGPTDVTARLTLAELMGRDGKPPSLSIEYDTLYTDGKLSLAQRVAVDPEAASVVLPVLIETPTSRYTVRSDDGEQELDRAGAAKLIDDLRSKHEHWNVYASEPTPADPGTTGQPGGGTGQPAGQPVSVVADLLAGPFGDGTLTKAFVELSVDADGAPSSTLVFDLQHAGDQSWRPQSGTVPPFRYEVTYLYAGNKTVRDQGTKNDLVLLLDPPAPPS